MSRVGFVFWGGREGGLQTSSKVYGSSQAGAEVAAGTKGQICRALLMYLLTTQQLWHKLIFYLFFAATADFCWNEGNEALQKGVFINAIHFYTKGIKTNCNEKELKAKLYNNRAIAHFKLGKMMRALICIFFPFEAKGCL